MREYDSRIGSPHRSMDEPADASACECLAMWNGSPHNG